MAIKTFTTGEVLTASDTNTYLANSGLVYVGSASASSGSSFSINSAFSATYDNYLIAISNFNCSLGARIYLRLRVGGSDTTTGYYYSTVSVPYSTTAPSNFGAANASFFYTDAVGDATQTGSAIINLSNPYLTTETAFMEQGVDARTSGSSGIVQGFLNDNTSYTGFTLLLVGQTFSSVNCTVYGYRKA